MGWGGEVRLVAYETKGDSSATEEVPRDALISLLLSASAG